VSGKILTVTSPMYKSTKFGAKQWSLSLAKSTCIRDYSTLNKVSSGSEYCAVLTTRLHTPDKSYVNLYTMGMFQQTFVLRKYSEFIIKSFVNVASEYISFCLSL